MADEITIRRVVTRTRGGQVEQAESPDRAAAKGIRPDVVFIRRDGWTLGARRRDQAAARRLWEGEWVALVDVKTCMRKEV